MNKIMIEKYRESERYMENMIIELKNEWEWLNGINEGKMLGGQNDK